MTICPYHNQCKEYENSDKCTDEIYCGLKEQYASTKEIRQLRKKHGV